MRRCDERTADRLSHNSGAPAFIPLLFGFRSDERLAGATQRFQAQKAFAAVGTMITDQSHRVHLDHQLGLVERDLEEKPQASDRGIERARRSAVIDQMQLVTSKVLDGRGIG
jgi:hypothetical protein